MSRIPRLPLFTLFALFLVCQVSCSPRTIPSAGGHRSGVLENGSFTADLNGFEIHYEVHGTGPVLMTVPNSEGLSLECLRALYGVLEERLTIVYFDPRGMGDSSAIREDADMGRAAVRADFDALRRHLGLDRVNAIAWSNVTENLLLLAGERPDTLSTAIILHGFASFGPEDAQLFAERFAEVEEEHADDLKVLQDASVPVEEKDRLLRKIWFEGIFPLSFADRSAGKILAPEIFKDTQVSFRHAVYSQNESPSFDLRARLPSIQIPCLILAGAHDILPVSKAEEMHEGIPESTLLIFGDSGHYAPLEEPEKFREAVYTFLGLE